MSKLAEKKKEAVAKPAAGPRLSITPADIEIPRLNVVQKMSQIEGPVGGVVIDRKAVLIDKDETCAALVVNATKGWRENIPFGSEEMPRIAMTESQKESIEGDSTWGEMLPFSDITLLFPQPKEGDEELYPYPIGNANYALGKVNASKDGYRCTYKRLCTFQMFNFDLPLCAKVWTFGAELITKGSHSWFIPTLTVTKEDAPVEAREFIERITG